MTRNPARTATCKQLLDTYHAGRGTTIVNKLTFTGVGHRDVYNITAPFMYNGEEVLMGRVEERDSEFSQVFFLHAMMESGGLVRIRIRTIYRTRAGPGSGGTYCGRGGSDYGSG